MPAPTVRPPNPAHLALLEALLSDPARATCPICGKDGFWDNREGKKNPKSPDFKCKNKDCVGATPMKAKQPYAVWIPDGFTPAAQPSKRLTHAEAAGDLPGDPASAYGEPPAAPPSDEEPDPRHESRHTFLAAYEALWRRCAAFQREVCQPVQTADQETGEVRERIPYDAASINAMASTIAIQWDRLGVAPR